MSKLYSPKDIILDAVFTGLVSLILFGPITGMVLNGYDFDLHPMRPIGIALIVTVGRFLSILAMKHYFKNRPIKPKKPGIDFDRMSLPVKIGGVVLIAVIALALPFFLSKYWTSTLILALIYVLLGLGLNIVVGLAGLLDLGYVAFYAVGAYGYALGNQYLGINFWEAIIFGAALAAILGTLLGFPVLRMHGDYLAIVTLGFGEIIFLVLTNWVDFTGGPNGASAPFPSFFGLEFKRTASEGARTFHETFGFEYSPDQKYIFIYLSLAVVVALVTYFAVRLKRMPSGRAWEALREDEIACRSLGINHVKVKLSAFALGAMIGGVAGTFFAGYQGFINPSSFNFFESALILAIVVLGGMGSIPGVMLAAVILTILPEFLRGFSEYRMIMFGLLMVIMMIWRPEGLIRGRRRVFQLNQ
ncbi:MAG: high-affinity branched-chain amino acid ABC transporter permease LivM [Oligoflexales bacterium]